MPLMITKSEVAAKLGIEDIVAYGLMRAMADLEVVAHVVGPTIPGRKGKPSTLYYLNRSVLARLHAILLEKVVIPMEQESAKQAELDAAALLNPPAPPIEAQEATGKVGLLYQPCGDGLLQLPDTQKEIAPVEVEEETPKKKDCYLCRSAMFESAEPCIECGM